MINPETNGDENSNLEERVNDFLEHHGIKGMHWGVRRNLHPDSGRSSDGDSSKTGGASEEKAKSEYQAIKLSKPTPAQQKKNLAENQAKFAAKFSPSEAEKKGLTEEQKKALKTAAITVGVIGGVAALAYLSSKSHGDSLDPILEKAAQDFKKDAGKVISPEKFEGAIAFSKSESWVGRAFIDKSSYDRPEFTIPAGNVFHRISRVAEKEFDKSTYSIPSVQDYHHYVAGFRSEKGFAETLQHVTWKSTEPIKVPTLTTTLETLRKVLKEQGKPSSKSAALIEYESLSGGMWNSGTATKLHSALAKKGYGAIIDEMDAGVIGDKPLVFFSKAVTAKSSSEITKDQINAAEKNLIELTNRKLGSYAMSHMQNEESVELTHTSSGKKTGQAPPPQPKTLSDPQRMMLAKMHLAMPNGSYYIRNGAIGSSDLDNAIQAVGRGVASGDNGDAIRLFITKRAAALKLSSKIPDTWNPDGSLKHSETLDETSQPGEINNFLEHVGITDLQSQMELHTAVANGTATKKQRLAAFGQMTSADVIKHKGSVQSFSKDRVANLQGLKDQANSQSTSHDSFGGDVDAFLEHFGILGMHWGRRKVKGPASEDHANVQAIRSKVKSAKGIHSLSNDELRTLTDRLNLESNYARLTSTEGDHVKNGEKFVRDNVSRVKLGVDTYNTGKQVYNIANDLNKALKK